MATLHIERSYSDFCYETYLVEGLTPDEVDDVIKAESWDKQRSILQTLLNKHDNDMGWGNLGDCWGCGYGIYDIRHFGGHLLVKIGNSCD